MATLLNMADLLLQITIWEFLKMQNNVDGLVPQKKGPSVHWHPIFGDHIIDISPVLLIHLIIVGWYPGYGWNLMSKSRFFWTTAYAIFTG